MTLTQAALLLSLGTPTGSSRCEDGHFWRDISLTSFRSWTLSVSNKGILKSPCTRIWWCLCIANNMAALCAGVHGSFVLPDYGLGLPSLSKFEFYFDVEMFNPVIQGSIFIKQPYLQKLLAEIFIHRAKLHKIISRILEETHESKPPAWMRQDLSQEDAHSAACLGKVLTKWDSVLDNWWSGLPDYASGLKSTFRTEYPSSVRLLSFHFAVTATEFFSISNVVHNILMGIDGLSPLWTLTIRHKSTMNSAKMLHIMSSLTEVDQSRYLLNHGLPIIESAFQRCLSPSVSQHPQQASRLLNLTKKVFDIRAAIIPKPVSLSSFACRAVNSLAPTPTGTTDYFGMDCPMGSAGEPYPAKEFLIEDFASTLTGESPTDGPTPKTPQVLIGCGLDLDSPDKFFLDSETYQSEDPFLAPCKDVNWVEV